MSAVTKSSSGDKTVKEGKESGALVLPLAKTELDNEELKETMEALQKKGREEKWAVTFEQVKFTGTKFASGSGGELFRVQWRGLECVAKTCPLTVGKQVLTDLANEISVLSTLRHPNLVMFLGACFEPHRPPVLLMEYCAGGNLEKKLFKLSAQGTRVKHSTALQYTTEMALALNFLHNCDPPVVHRDVKPSNILLTKTNQVKVTDFGLSKFIPKAARSSSTEKQKDKYVLTGETGSYRFMAPEVFRHEEYNEKVDVYSFALIVYWLFTGQRPFAEIVDPVEAARQASTGSRTPNKLLLPSKYRDLIARCWSQEPDERPSFEEIVNFLLKNNSTGTRSSCSVQ